MPLPSRQKNPPPHLSIIPGVTVQYFTIPYRQKRSNASRGPEPLSSTAPSLPNQEREGPVQKSKQANKKVINYITNRIEILCRGEFNQLSKTNKV